MCRFIDERNNEVGEALILSWDEAGLVLETSGACFEQTSPRAGWTDRMDFHTTMAAKANNTGTPRTYLVCPSCRRPFGVLIYKGRWGCGDCLKLGYRSQFVPPDVFATTTRADLHEKIGGGRPRGMRQTTYRKAVEKLAALKPKAGAFPSVPSLAHQRVVRATWLTPAEAGHLLHDGFEVVDGNIKPAAWRAESARPAEEQPPTPTPAPFGQPVSPPIILNLDPWIEDDAF